MMEGKDKSPSLAKNWTPPIQIVATHFIGV
jgi:hypothetical protein